MKQTRHGPVQRLVARLTLVVFVLTGAGPASGQATDTVLGPAETTHGSGEFTINDPTHTEYTQYSPRAIVDWGVDIQQPADHHLAFRQQQGFAVLNQSPGVRASNFYGTVSCDATCIFTNEAGIYFQDGSFVDVGQVIAAAGTISSTDFLAGDYDFGNLFGEVVNYGHLRGDSITLLGQRVANFGHVETPGGSFAMLAGSRILLRDLDSPILIESDFVPPPRPASDPFGDTPAVENAGTIDATDGDVRLAAGDMLSFAIRQSGEIRARRIALEGGDGGLVEVSGLLDASDTRAGQTGGEIDVLGDYVLVQGDVESSDPAEVRTAAVLDASGSAGGGRIRVGGDRQGAPGTRTARSTYVHADATLKADAIDQGDGGEVVVWADDTAWIYGEISALGGEFGGNGGFVETSGKRWLDVTRAPLLQARSGLPGDRGGDWLIDPNNIEIVAGGCGDRPQCLDDGLAEDNTPVIQGSVLLQPTVDDTKITAGVIADSLESGVSVTIATQTIAQVQGEQVGNIKVSAAIEALEADAEPGTEVSLVLAAAQDIEVDQAIRVVRSTGADQPSGLRLNVTLLAGEDTQAQAAAPVDQVPNNFLGVLDINADIETAGGSLSLKGFGVNTATGTTLTTNGGLVDVSSLVGDITHRGTIDTSTIVTDNLTGDTLTGGTVTMRSEVTRRPLSGAADTTTEPIGGSIDIAGAIRSGGGLVDLTADGGDLRVRSSVSSAGGSVVLRALERTLGPVTAGDVAVTTGGAITIDETATIATEGGFVDVGVADLVQLIPGAKSIDMRGVIDTRVRDEADPSQLDFSQLGGAVLFNAAGADSVIRIGSASGGPAPQIATNGRAFESFGDGRFEMTDGIIDTRFDPGSAPSAMRPEGLDSRILVQHRGAVDIGDPTLGGVTMAAEETLTILAGLEQGIGDLTFRGPTTLLTDDISLIAGDGEAPIGVGTGARIDLSGASIQGFTNASPMVVSVQQDADLLGDTVADALAGGVAGGVETLTLAAWDGLITIADPTKFTAPNPGMEPRTLNLRAGDGIAVTGAFNPDPVNGPAPLEVLDIEVVNDFRLDAPLAQSISNAARKIDISAGAASDADDPSLTIAGTDASGAPAPLTLIAEQELVLQAGARGLGDLAFEGQVELRSPDITLRAGDGDADGTSAVRTAGLDGVTFSDRAGTGQVTAFTLRQDAAIDDATVPDIGRFVGGVAGVDYTLRADALGSGITLGSNGATALQDTNLSLHASGPIDLSALADGELQIQSLDIGGLGSFQYTQEHNSKFSFMPGVMSRDLVIRAGLTTFGVLSFDSDLTVTADTVRLVASDGVGGNGSGPSGSLIRLARLPGEAGADPVFQSAPGVGLREFVFRQDDSITQDILPQLAVHFAGNAPMNLAIRSDDGDITFTDFSAPILEATDQVVVSAPTIVFDRTDGQNLVIDEVFATPANLELRGDTVEWRATDVDSTGTTKVLTTNTPAAPPTQLTLTAFDRPDASAPADDGPPPALEFDPGANPDPMNPRPVDLAPSRIRVTQDADIDAADLIALNQLGYAGDAMLNAYTLTSNEGSITVTPDKVMGADLFLILTPSEDAPQPRTINFSDAGGVGFVVESVLAETPYAWTVENTAGGALDITATEAVDLIAALENEANANLAFGPNGVTLRGRSIQLRAGDPNAAAPEDRAELPVVDTQNLNVVLEDQSTDQIGTEFFVLQQGGFTDQAPGSGQSRIIDTSQISVVGDPDNLIDRMRLTSFSWNAQGSETDPTVPTIEITQLIDDMGQPFLPTRELRLVAGWGPDSGGEIFIGQETGTRTDLDLVDAAGAPLFDELLLFGQKHTLSATRGRVRARDGGIGLFGSVDVNGNEFAAPPTAFEVVQDLEVAEVGDGTSCTTGCLPDAFQFGSSGVIGVDYTIRSTTGRILVNEPLAFKTFGSDLSLVASNVDFDLATTARPTDLVLTSLTVGDPAQGPTTISIDGTGPLPLTVFTTGAQTWNGPVVIDGAVQLEGDIVEFTSTIVGSGASDELIVRVVTEARFDDNVGRSDPMVMGNPNERLERLRIEFDPNAATAGAVRFGSAAGGTDTVVDADLVEFLGFDDLSNVAIPRSPITSTIYKRNGNLSFNVVEFAMGVGERLTVQGNLLIDATGQATIGDLSGLEIAVRAPTINIVRRLPGSYLDRAGQLQADGGTDFVANTIDFQGNIVLTGAGQDPIFAVADPRSTPAFMDAFAVLGIQGSGLPLTAGDFEWPFAAALPDLHPEGASRDDVSSMFFEEDLVPPPPAWRGDAWLPWARSALTDLFVFARPLDRREWATVLGGAPIVDDVGQALQAWDGRPLPIAARRIDGEGAQRAVELFEEIFGADGGNVPHLRRTLQRAVDRYVRNTGSRRVVGFELRRFVKNRPSSLFASYQLLEDLDTLFAYHRDLGLTPGEYRPIQARWLAAIRPEGITTAELAEAVQPSRYVRGSDVLDIFGD